MQVKVEHLPELLPMLYGVTSQWEQFGNALHINFDTIQNIRLTPIQQDPTSKMMTLLDKILSRQDPKTTWEDIEGALKALRNFNLASRLPQTGPVPVTWSNAELMELLRGEIANWRRFGMYMRVPPEELDLIDASKLTPDQCFEKLMETWIKEKEKEATLEAIVNACRHIRDHALAKELEENEKLKILLAPSKDLPLQIAKDGVCYVYKEAINGSSSYKITVVIAKKDKYGMIERTYGTKNIHKQDVTVESDLSLEAHGWQITELKPEKINKSSYDNGQLCAFKLKVTQSPAQPQTPTMNLSLKLVGVAESDNTIFVPLQTFATVTSPSSTGHTADVTTN